MTHYTILTIKQQLLKLQFIYSINGDGSKTAKKIIKKVILLSITLALRRCDGG